MEIRATKENIFKLIDKLEKRKYILPKFQRDFTWDNSKTQALYNSIIKKHPIGAITLYKNGKTNLIIDGQQRLTSILKLNNDDKTKFKEDFKYEIPTLIWECEDNEDDKIAQFFVDMNDNGSPLDKEDITLTMLSEIYIDIPSWFKQSDHNTINKMYKDRNQLLGVDSSQ